MERKSTKFTQNPSDFCFRKIMRQIFTLFLCLLVSVGASAQEVIKGRVVSEEVPLSQVLVMNMQTGEKSYTNTDGKFSILGKIGHELRLVRKGYDRMAHLVTTSDFSQELNFEMKPAETMINEIVITKVSKEKLANLQKSIGIPQANWKVREKGKVYSTKDALLPLLMGGVNIQAINDLANGDARRRKNLYKYEDFQENVEWIRNRTDVGFWVEKGIPEERLSEFITFAIIEKPEIKSHIKSRNIIKVEETMQRVLHIYVNRLKESEK